MPDFKALPLPSNTAPTGERCLQVTIPDDDDYEMLLLSAVNLLSFWYAYDRDDAHSGALVANIFKKVMVTWTDCAGNPVIRNVIEEVDTMAGLFEPYCDDNGNCRFHFKCDICGDWHDVALLSDLQSTPGAGAPQPKPGGGSINKCVTLQADGILLLDAPVSTGDVITIVSASGSANDGAESVYRCPDGKVYSAGNCTPGSTSIDGSDPVSTPPTPHMSVIIEIGGTAYPLYPGASFTVPSGVSGALAKFRVNQHTPSTTTGAYDICYKQTNNQAVPWCHRLDFTVSPYGFVDYGSSGGATVWAAGIGWRHPNGIGTDTKIKFVSGTSFTVTAISFLLGNSATISDSGSAMECEFPSGTQYDSSLIVPLVLGPNSFSSVTTASGMQLNLIAEHGHDGELSWDNIVIHGTGFDPFAAYPAC